MKKSLFALLGLGLVAIPLSVLCVNNTNNSQQALASEDALTVKLYDSSTKSWNKDILGADNVVKYTDACTVNDDGSVKYTNWWGRADFSIPVDFSEYKSISFDYKDLDGGMSFRWLIREDGTQQGYGAWHSYPTGSEYKTLTIPFSDFDGKTCNYRQDGKTENFATMDISRITSFLPAATAITIKDIRITKKAAYTVTFDSRKPGITIPPLAIKEEEIVYKPLVDEPANEMITGWFYTVDETFYIVDTSIVDEESYNASKQLHGTLYYKDGNTYKVSNVYADSVTYYYKEVHEDVEKEFKFNCEISRNYDLYAKWAKCQTVKYYTNCKTTIDDKKTEIGTTIYKPAGLKKESGEIGVEYRLDNWYKEEIFKNEWNFENDVVTQNTTLYAKWKDISGPVLTNSVPFSQTQAVNEEKTSSTSGDTPAVQYTVSFSTGSGSDIDPILVPAGGKVTKPANPTWDGHEFIGWYKEVEYKDVYDFATLVKEGENISIFAKWIKTYTVHFETNGGRKIADEAVDENGLIKTASNPIKTGYTFAGWYLDEELTTPFSLETQVTKPLTLYASWQKAYIIHFDVGESPTTISDQTVKAGDKVIKPEDPVNEGYVFGGWYDEEGNPFDFENTIPTKDTNIIAKWEVKNNGGCGGSVIAPISIVILSGLTAIGLVIAKKKGNKEK